MGELLDRLVQVVKQKINYNPNRVGKIMEDGLNRVNESFHRVFIDDYLHLRNCGYERGENE